MTDRKKNKELRAQYREFVNMLAEAPSLSYRLKLNPHGDVQVMDDGAFVEVHLWIPKEILDKYEANKNKSDSPDNGMWS